MSSSILFWCSLCSLCPLWLQFLAGNQPKRFAHLLETHPQQKMRVSPVTLRPQHEEIRLRVTQHVRSLAGLLKAILAALSRQRRGQLHWPLRGVTDVNLQFAEQFD